MSTVQVLTHEKATNAREQSKKYKKQKPAPV
jgi:hypothetical protein